jgi:hypothetical protein
MDVVTGKCGEVYFVLYILLKCGSIHVFKLITGVYSFEVCHPRSFYVTIGCGNHSQ